MGITDIFGLGTKEKKEEIGKKDKPFKVPHEVTVLRHRIEMESRENFPNQVRYQELVREAEEAYRSLDEIVKKAEQAEDALRTRDDIRKRLEALEAKIKSNKNEGRDYVEKNIDYLERKSTRNVAKTLFTEFLEAYERFLSLCREGGPEQTAALDTETTGMLNALSPLHSKFIKVYTKDREIQELKDLVLVKISELDQFCTLNASGLEGRGLKTGAESSVKNLQNAAKKMSGN